MSTLTIDQIRDLAPSVFSEKPLDAMSEKYRFVPTYEVLEGLMNNGFQPVMAGQTKANKPSRASTNRHVLRFRHDDMIEKASNLKDSVPEIVLFNSHNGMCTYRLMFGMFRMVCANGMIVQSSQIGEVAVRHIGNQVDNVIEESFKLIEEAPKVVNQIKSWQGIELNRKQQLYYAKKAMAIRPTNIDFDHKTLLEARRPADDINENGSRDLWRTMNVVQENIIRGGFVYTDAKGASRQMRAVKAVHADEIINRGLWAMTDNYAMNLQQ